MKTIVVANQDIVQEGMSHTLLKAMTYASIVAEAESLAAAITAAERTQPDAVLLDDSVLNDDPMAFELAIKALRKKYNVKMIIAFIDKSCHNTLITRLMNLPIAGVISKDTKRDDIIEIIQKIQKGERYISPSLRESVYGTLSSSEWRKKFKSPFDALSDQENAVVSLLLDSVSVSTIGEKLSISRRTVHTYRYRIFDKLKVDNENDLLRLALEWGLLKINMKNVTLMESFVMFLKRNTSQLIALSAAASIMIWGILASDNFVQTIVPKVSWFIDQFGASVLYLSSACLLIALGIICSPLGNIRLGEKEDKPEFSTWTWISMIAVAGFTGPVVIQALQNPLIYAHSSDWISSSITDPTRQGMILSMLRNGFHAWALMSACALMIAIPAYFIKSSMLSSETIRLGFKLSKDNPKQKKFLSAINIITALTIVFGASAVLAATGSVLQAGFKSIQLFKDNTFFAAVICILLIAAVFSVSTVSGIRQGIRKLSRINAVLALSFVSIVLLYFFSEIGTVISTFFQTMIDYVTLLPAISVSFDTEFVKKPLSSLLYNTWFWFLAYAPFVGTFAAIVSRGRSLREFLTGMIIFPTMLMLLLYAVFGGLGLKFYQQTPAAFADLIPLADYSVRWLFVFFENFTAYPQLFSLAAILLVCCFMITSSDSACYVIAYQFEQKNMLRSTRIRVVWCMVVLTITLMLMSHGNLKVNYAVAIIGSLAFAVVLILKLIACGLLFYRRLAHGEPIKIMQYIYNKQYTPFLEDRKIQANVTAPYNLTSHTENSPKKNNT